METNHEQFINRSPRTAERGNALVYVLIAIALFAALSMTLGRQTGTDEAGHLSDERAALHATDIINYAVQVKSAVDQMIFTGSEVDDLDFTLPTDAAFNTAPHIHKVYHPEGGGLTPARIPEGAIDQNITDPPAGWYLGRFNNVEWTETTAMDVILVAYQIKADVCAKINEKVNGSATIPQMGDSIHETMIDDNNYTGTNTDLTTDDAGDICPECDRVATLCVQNQAGTAYGYYTIIADQ